MTTHFGLDIGTDSIKVVQVSFDKQSVSLLSAGMIKSPPNGLSSDSDKDLVAMAEAIKKLKSDSNITVNEVSVSLPERFAFTQVFEFPKMSDDELTQAIPWEAENLLPHPLSAVNLDWEIYENNETGKADKVRVLLIASPKDLVDKYLKMLKLANLIPVSMETEFLSILRCLTILALNERRSRTASRHLGAGQPPGVFLPRICCRSHSDSPNLALPG